MALQRGERQTQRTKEALQTAFTQLTQEKNYSAITINDIIDRANIGRSTFYRYFQSKADLLLSLHEGVFDHLGGGLSSPSDWLADDPPAQLVMFLQKYQRYEGLRRSFLYDLRTDVDYVVSRMDDLLTRQFEESLHRSFAETDSNIPFPVLARSIAGTYSWLIRFWFTERQPLSPPQIAGHIHRLARAAIREAFADADSPPL